MEGNQTPQTRGFLFSDLRDYSAFTERHGDAAARELLARYRRLVRDVIATFDGAEVRTEGDSFYVVFDSVSRAVRAGLAILEAVRTPPSDVAPPIRVGIGIHAGEAEDSGEGIVSGAVNLAARICAQAQPGELLVSDTVRALTRTYLDVKFVPRGRRRLKGIDEPVGLFHVSIDAASARAFGASRTRVPPVALAVAGSGAVLLVALLAWSPITAWISGLNLAASMPPPETNTTAAQPPSTVSATPTASIGTRSRSPDVFPNQVEAQLLTLIPESEWDRCERAAEADLPVLDHVQVVGTFSGSSREVKTYRTAISAWGGVHCRLGGISAPDSVWYWRVGLREEVAEWIAQQAPKVGAVTGSCASAEAAVERWSFGAGSGSLLCYTTETGDAILHWTYDQTNIYGRALRDDMDAAALLRWWTTEARFLPE